MRISAVICTHNRSGYLRKAINSLLEQSMPSNYYEIVIVDNGSTDDTRNVVPEEFAGISNIRYIYEPILGLSQARNTGMTAAKGEYVAYLDDDAVASSAWLETILRVFDNVHPCPAAVGGKVEPDWEVPRPAWLPDSILVYLGTLNLSDAEFSSDSRPVFSGGNSAYPKHVLEEVGGFSTSVGRIGKCLLSSEEVLLWEQLRERGYTCYYHPDILISHHIPASRLTQRYCLNRMYWEGISQSVGKMQQEHMTFSARLSRATKLLLRTLIMPRRLAGLIFPAGDAKRFEQKCRVIQDLGYAAAMLGLYNRRLR